MTGEIIDGKAAAAAVRGALKEDVAEYIRRTRRPPGLAVVLVGDNPASQVYVRMKERACQEVGISSEKHQLPKGTHQDDLLRLVRRLNQREDIHGILVQLPLPEQIDEHEIIAAVAPHKDVDGFHPINAGLLVSGSRDGLVPCTPAGVIELIKLTRVPIAGRHAVVVGRSNIVGKPTAILLLQEDATVTVAHSKTEDLQETCRQADILVVAAGRPGMITSEYVKPGAMVIDVGVNRLADGGLIGDVDFERVKSVASFITPVPGGVGPMTIAMLLRNTLRAARRDLSV